MLTQLKKKEMGTVPNKKNADSYALYDVMMTSTHNKPVLNVSKAHELHGNAARSLAEFTPKQFVFKKKKKRISVLKKRILMVRFIFDCFC